MLASLSGPSHLRSRGTAGGRSDRSWLSPASRQVSSVGPSTRPRFYHSRRKETGPQHASLGVARPARTSSHWARLPTA
jgi:hypothetical protein